MTENTGPSTRLTGNHPAVGRCSIGLAWVAAAILVAVLALGPAVRRALYLNLASLAVARSYARQGATAVVLPSGAAQADVNQALRFSGALLELDGDQAAAWRQMGHALALAGELSQAEVAFQRAIAASPGDNLARDALAQLYVATGRHDQAVSVWRQLRYAARLAALGQRLAEERRWQEAIAAFEAAVEVSPEHADAYYGLGWARYRWVGDVTGALAAFLAVRSLEPGSPWPYVTIGDLYVAAGHTEEAFPWYEQALKVAPREPVLQRRVAEVYVQHGARLLQAQLRDQAEGAFRRALELDPENAHAQLQLDTLPAAP